MFTQKCPARCISGQARDVRDGQNSTSGGFSETELNDWHVMPTGSPLLIEVTTVTPVAKRPSTSRKWRACASASGSSGIGVSSPRRKWKSKAGMNWSISSGDGQVWRGPRVHALRRLEVVRAAAGRFGGHSAAAEVVAPVAHRGRLAGDPARVVDLQSLAAVLHVEPSR